MSTVTRITRAEAIRRFRAASHATIVARTIKGVPTPNNPPTRAGQERPVVGVRREIARVTGTGVYYKDRLGGWEPTAATRFAETVQDEWHEDADGNPVLVTYYSHMDPAGYTQREFARITYKLEASA